MASYSSLTAFLVLVGAIAAVVGAVTHPVGGNAAVVGAFKLGGCAEFVCRGRHRSHSRYYLPEPMSFFMYSENVQKTALFFSGMVFVSIHFRSMWGRPTTVRLISSVLTVILLITSPAHGNAATTGASEEVDWAFKFPLI